MRVTGTNLPFKSADIRFVLENCDGSTTVCVSPEYALKYGFAGRLLDAIMINRVYRKGMRALLGGLKEHVEKRAAIAKLLVELANTYAEAGWQRAAVEVLERAGAFSATAGPRFRAARSKSK